MLVFLVMTSTVLAQKINRYKYAIIPETYEFTGEKDQYQLNSLTKFLLKKEGFNTLMTTEKTPEDLKMDPCLAFNTRVKDNSGIFVTKLVLIFEDCSGEEVFRSKEGRSREKEFKKAYHEALRDAFESIEELNYNYSNDRQIVGTQTGNAKEKLEKRKKPLEKSIKNEPSIGVKFSQENYYSFEGQDFRIEEVDQKLALYSDGASEPIAILIPSENGNYIYNSLLLQGVAYFDDSGNFIVEYFDSGKDEKVKRVYLLKN